MTFLRRRPSVDHRGWTAPPKPIFGRRGITALLLVTLLGGAFVSVTPPNASADALSDAIAQQKALQAQIDRQKAQISALTAVPIPPGSSARPVSVGVNPSSVWAKSGNR